MVEIGRLPPLFIILALACAGPSSWASEFAVESRVTWASPGMPEVHLLIRNQSQEPVGFVAELGAASERTGLRCHGHPARTDEAFVWRFSRWDSVSRGISRGLMPAGGWSHRSIALGTGGVSPPCEIPYRVMFPSPHEGQSEVRGVISVPAMPPSTRDRGPTPVLGWESSVEKDDTRQGRLVARLLVTNRSDHPTRLLITNRQLTCVGGTDARLALHDGTLQGQDVGPFEVDSLGWTVFVMAVDSYGNRGGDPCRITVELSADTSAGLRSVETVEFPLKPTALLSRP
jgi:hypothetical protein